VIPFRCARQNREAEGLVPEEHGHPHGHGTGVRWLDIIVGLSAMFISVVSLVVSFEHGRTMRELVHQNEKLVAASTIPVLDFSTSNLDESNRPYFKFSIKNGGVGPAVIDWFELRYKGVAYSKPEALLQACCAEAMAKDKPKGAAIWYSTITNSILPTRDTFDPLTLRPEIGNNVLSAFYHARTDISARACYCSVLDECWQTNFDANRPLKVDRCDTPANAVLW
jgi:hypothetical protein